MNIGIIITAAFIALGFVSWVIVGDYSKASAGWVGTIVMTLTALVVTLLSIKQLIGGQLPGMKAIIYLVIAGIINGIAVYFYAFTAQQLSLTQVIDQSTTTSSLTSTGVFVVIVAVLMAVFAPCVDWILNSKILSLQQGIGVCFAVLSIYLLAK